MTRTSTSLYATSKLRLPPWLPDFDYDSAVKHRSIRIENEIGIGDVGRYRQQSGCVSSNIHFSHKAAFNSIRSKWKCEIVMLVTFSALKKESKLKAVSPMTNQIDAIFVRDNTEENAAICVETVGHYAQAKIAVTGTVRKETM
ncbi:hypothetical protein RB195_004115 [Necator americanus]|uniref:Uncharacterized protein n=1 Tax=Necator americanus TaxID=51031 RepID=A0ABR1BI77_NECAM